MDYRKLDDIYTIIFNSEYDKLHKYDNDDINIVLKLRFNGLEIDYNKYANKEIRTHCYKFRNTIINRYIHCPLTCINSHLCEAAHILPYNKCNEFEKYNEHNGILLCPNMHKAYDKHYFIIDDKTCRIKVLYDNISDSTNLGLESINNLYIKQLDNMESKLFLKKRNMLINKID